MITNNSVTIYHKGFNKQTRLETWTRYNYSNVWFFGGRGAGLNRGYADANDVEVRIPYDQNTGLNINDFAIGDIVIAGTLELNINSQQDLDGYLKYNITSINDNNFGNNPHIHIGGK